MPILFESAFLFYALMRCGRIKQHITMNAEEEEELRQQRVQIAVNVKAELDRYKVCGIC